MPFRVKPGHFQVEPDQKIPLKPVFRHDQYREDCCLACR
jgi:hypothetical protein